MSEQGIPEYVTYSGILKEKAPQVSEELTHTLQGLSEGVAATALALEPNKRPDLTQTLKDLDAGIFARSQSENLRKPEMVITALAGASALLAPEPSEEFKESAQKMVDELRKRYNLS